MNILQAIAVGLLNDNAFNPSGIYGNSGIYWEYPEDNVKYVLEVNQNSGIEKGDKLEFDDDFDEDAHPELEVDKLYVIGSDGKPQMTLEGGERIFSRISTRTMIKKAKKAFVEKTDNAYKSLGKYVFKEMKAQDSRKPEFVNKPNNQ